MKYIYKLKNKSQTLPLQVLAVALIAVVILLFTSGILSSNSERLVTAAQDAACRAYLESSATTIARLGSSIEQLVRAEQTFFGQLPRYCRTEFLILEQRNEEYVSQRFSDAAQRCYNRYGAGELNFLGYTQREGSFCFICAEIEFENADSQDYQSYRYLDIATFMENEIPQQRNEERKNARELANLFYVDIKGGESALINTDLRIQSRFSMYGEDTLPYFLNALENYEYFKNIYQREFRVQDKTYVVYRYELTSSDFDSLLAAQQLQGALTS
ncbi:MAG: hypothetical protein LAT82_02655, partial [Nanoarchaeota archaeon]|nr:hypothetical protein [Nanoarchaeota archaeon]